MAGVFIAVGIIPQTELLDGLADRNDGGYVLAGEDGITSAEGIFAAGDCRSKNLRQIITAVISFLFSCYLINLKYLAIADSC